MNVSAVRQIVFIILFLANTVTAWSQDYETLFRDIDSIFVNIVIQGKVDYGKLAHDRSGIDSVLTRLQALNVPVEAAEEKAFWINVYNLLVIYSIAEAYPVTSPKEISGFFENRSFRIGGSDYTLNKIEKEILLVRFPDARLHFALVCGAMSCPPLASHAFQAGQLDNMLDAQTRLSLSDENFIRIDHTSRTIQLSEICKWYEKDFLRESTASREYFTRYRTRQLPPDYALYYYPYDWRLNDSNGIMGKGSVQQMNLQSRTPSNLLPEATFEFKVFNNLYTQTAWFNGDGDRQSLPGRDSFFTSAISAYYGLSDAFDVGVEVYVKSTRIDAGGTSPLSFLGFSSAARQESVLAAIAPKIKFAFPNIGGFGNLFDRVAVQTLLLLPLAQDLENRGGLFIDYASPQLWTQIFVDFPVWTHFLAYVELGAITRFDDDRTVVRSPFKAFFNYYPNAIWTIYFPVELNPRWAAGNETGLWASWYLQTGLGLKYAFSGWWEFEILYTSFIAGKAEGAGQTFNVGSRVLF